MWIKDKFKLIKFLFVLYKYLKGQKNKGVHFNLEYAAMYSPAERETADATPVFLDTYSAMDRLYSANPRELQLEEGEVNAITAYRLKQYGITDVEITSKKCLIIW